MTRPATVSELKDKAEAIASEAPMVELRTSHDSLASALVAALEDLTMVKTGRTVDFTTDKGVRVHYDYADLGDVVKITRPALARHGLVALTPVHDHGQGLACTVTILHDGGERMDFGPFPFPHGRDAQATGSMVTYHRRYALVAALGMAAGDDDDGAAAKPRQAEPPRTVSPRAMAKQALFSLCDESKTRANEAWEGISGDSIKWGSDPAAEVERLYEAWVNEPADEPEGESNA